MATPARNLDSSALQDWLWDAPCAIRGTVDGRDYEVSGKLGRSHRSSRLPKLPSPLISSSQLSPSPIAYAERLRFSFGLLPRSFSLVSALDLSPSPIALSARGSSACEPRLTGHASVFCGNSRQALKEPHRHVQAGSPDLFSLPSTPTRWMPVPLDLP